MVYIWFVCVKGALPDIDAEQDPNPEEYSIQARPTLEATQGRIDSFLSQLP